MNRDKGFTLKIAFFNSMGYFVTAAGVTFVDAKLVSSPFFGARHYPLGYWICLGAPIVFLLSILFVRRFKSWKRKALWPTLCLLLISAISLPNFRPGFPHMGFFGGTFFYCAISLIASWIHYAPLDIEWIADSRIDRSLKLERLKELITFWRTLTLSIVFGWMALMIPWTSFFWSSSKAFLETPAEVVINSNAWTVAMCGFSIFVLFGPVYESFRKTTCAVDQILQLDMAINTNKEKAANNSLLASTPGR
jgi:hypothetical protein